MEANIPSFCQSEKKNWNPILAIVWPVYDYKDYAKDTDGLFARIIGKISALTILQYINYKNEKPVGRVKYALF